MGKSSSPAALERARTIRLGALLASIVLAVYLLLPTRNYYWDGIYFAQTIEDSAALGPSLLHPNHLIYEVLGYGLNHAFAALGLKLRALVTLRLANSILSALAALVFFNLLLPALGSRYLAFLLAVWFAFSATWWRFSIDANSYIPSVLFLVLTFALVLPGRKPRPLLAAVTHAAAMLLHQLAVLFCPVALLGIAFQTSGRSRTQKLFNLGRYFVPAFFLTASGYYAGFLRVRGHGDRGSFTQWLTSHSSDVSFSFDLWKNLVYTLRGNIRLFLGGRPALVLIGLKALGTFSGILAVGTLCFLCYRLWHEAASPAQGRGRDESAQSPSRRVAALAGAWISIYSGFLFFWLPQNTFYRLFYFPAILVLVGSFFPRPKAPPNSGLQRGTAVAATLVIFSNLVFLISPYSSPAANPPLALALEMSSVWKPGTLVYYAAFNTDDGLIRYFNPTTRWQPLDSHDLCRLEQEVRRVSQNGGTVWLETTAIETLTREHAEFQSWLATHTREGAKRELIYPGYRIRLVQLFPQ